MMCACEARRSGLRGRTAYHIPRRSLGEPRLAEEGLLGRYERPMYRVGTVRVRDGWQLHLSRFVWCILGALFLLSLAGSPVFGQQFENQLAWVDNFQ